MSSASATDRPVSLMLAEAVRAMGVVGRRLGLSMPGFRSPPRVAGALRTIRRHRGGGATVAVALRDRPWAAVLADLVEGVVVANRLAGLRADGVRAELWAALAPGVELVALGSAGLPHDVCPAESGPVSPDVPDGPALVAGEVPAVDDQGRRVAREVAGRADLGERSSAQGLAA
ncbi:MAG: hypothetical protein AB7L84_09130 [Acidimicrobiia bacterium]